MDEVRESETERSVSAPDHAVASKQRLATAWVATLGLGALLAMAYCVLRSPILEAIQADYIWSALLLEDLRNPTLDFAWVTPPSPFFFPDLLFIFVADSLGLEIYRSAVFLHVVTLGAALGFWMKSANPRGVGYPEALSIGMLCALAYLVAATSSRGMTSLVLMPFCHGNAVSLLLLVWGLLLPLLRGEVASRRRSLSALVLVAVATLSDRILLAQCIAPALLVIGARAGIHWRHGELSQRKSTLLRALFILVLGGVLALLLRKLINFSGVFYIPKAPMQLELAEVGATWSNFEKDLPALLRMPLSWVALGASGYALMAAWRWQRSNGEHDSAPVLRYPSPAMALIGVTLVASVTAPILTSNWTDLSNTRYILPLFVLPLAAVTATLRAGASAVSGELGALGRYRAVLLAVTLLGVSFYRVGEFDPPSRHYPSSHVAVELSRMARAEGWRRGLAGYWFAKPLTHQAQQREGVDLTLNAIRPTGELMPWIENIGRYWTATPSGALAPQVDFILMSNLEPPAIESRYGSPARVAEVAGHTVWVYDESQRAETTELLGEIERVMQRRFHRRMTWLR